MNDSTQNAYVMPGAELLTRRAAAAAIVTVAGGAAATQTQYGSHPQVT